MASDDTASEESFQCLNGVTTTSNKDKNQNLAENKSNRKEPKKFKDSTDVSSVQYLPTLLVEGKKIQDNDINLTQNNKINDQSDGSFVNREQIVHEYPQITPINVNSPKVQESSICPCCTIM